MNNKLRIKFHWAKRSRQDMVRGWECNWRLWKCSLRGEKWGWKVWNGNECLSYRHLVGTGSYEILAEKEMGCHKSPTS